jgi:hypothetical protein
LSVADRETLAMDEEQERTVGLLLLGNGAVLAHGFDRPLAVEMDEKERSGELACRQPQRYRNARDSNSDRVRNDRRQGARSGSELVSART